jgi:hypothetical protein
LVSPVCSFPPETISSFALFGKWFIGIEKSVVKVPYWGGTFVCGTESTELRVVTVQFWSTLILNNSVQSSEASHSNNKMYVQYVRAWWEDWRSIRLPEGNKWSRDCEYSIEVYLDGTILPLFRKYK